MIRFAESDALSQLRDGFDVLILSHRKIPVQDRLGPQKR